MARRESVHHVAHLVMPIELHIQTGALAGIRQTFDKSVVSIGRHPTSDLRFDAEIDLDVSTRHGEIRMRDGEYTIHDSQSTNGTFVNGVRVPPGGSVPLTNNDLIAFGPEGPQALVRIVVPPPPAPEPPPAPAVVAPPPPIVPRASAPKPAPPPPPVAPTPIAPPAVQAPRPSQGPPRRPTEERVAAAVREQTRGLRTVMLIGLIVLGGGAGGIFYKAHRDARSRDDRIKQLIAANEELNREFRTRLQGDTALTNSLQRHNDSLTQAVREARGAAQAAAASLELQRSHQLQRQFTSMGLPAVRDANDGAIVLISSEIRSQSFESTGFCVSPTGLVITNRHVVVDATSGQATRILIKFANTPDWYPAHVVKLPDDPNTDLALLQIEGGGISHPSVHDVARSVDVPVGTSIATLGFPLGTDLPMEGNGADEIAKTSLTIGTVSKSVTGLLQIDAFASHGSSGSPVFDGHGHVIGVVWGGPKGGEGRIVFAVPAEEIRKLIQ